MSDNPNVAEVVAFLLGEAPLEGRWFGDEDNLPTVAGRPARYWWRSHLRAALEAQASAGDGVANCTECGAFMELVRPGKYQHPTCSQASAPGVLVDFPGIGMAGPFTPAGNTLTLPDVTMTDLAHHFRMGYVEQASAPGGEVTEEMVAAALDAQPFKDANSGTRVWQLIASDGEGTETVMRAALTAALAALEAQASAPGGEVTDAAYRWWLSHRPLAFNEAEHLANPGINTCSDTEKALAKAVAAARAARTGKGE